MQRRNNVLIVEDEPLVRAVAIILIEEELGCTCEVATSRNEALRALQDHAEHVAVIFTDLMMASETDGAELARIVSRRWPWIGILVTSGGAPPPVSALPGKAKFVAKPWRPDEVKRFIASRLHSA
ncbi:MAG: response regulator [Methylobacteriaceae bacterium]|nr:response regulator [Methylobacteriaceae bacterium]